MDASNALKELAEPWGRGEKIKGVIARAAKLSGLGYWRAFDIWYGKARRVEQHEADMIADALQRKREMAAKNELSELRLRLEKLDSLLRQTDQGFYRPDIDLAGAQVR